MTIDDLLANYSKEIRDLILAARALILECFPHALEQVDLPSRLLAYGTSAKYADPVFTLMPQVKWVNVGIYRALKLPDPHGLLQGTGKLHRHVKIHNLMDLKSSILRDLLQAAVNRKMKSG